MPGAKKKRRFYATEFKAQVVQLMRAGRSAESISAEYGVHVSTLRTWLWRARVDAGEVEGLTTEERAELAQLRRENAKLREEREILKKFAAWSAQEANWSTKKRSDS
jgi:transposase